MKFRKKYKQFWEIKSNFVGLLNIFEFVFNDTQNM